MARIKSKNMFWLSVLEGFYILRHWQIWVAILFYVAITMTFLFLIGIFSGSKESGGRIVTGCITYIIGGSLLHAFLMSIMIIVLLPILLGKSEMISLNLIKPLLFPLFKLGLFAFIIVTFLSIIPFIGAFIGHSPSIQAFLEGIIIFRGLTDPIIYDFLEKSGFSNITVYPNFWLTIGFLIIAGIFTWLLVFVFAFISMKLESTPIGELMPIVFGPSFGLLGGIIPLLMYTSYVRLSLIKLL